MTSFQRVAAALSHQEADHVPVYPILCGINRKLVDATYEKWATDAETCAAGFLKTAELFDLDCLVTLIDLSIECDAWGQKLIFPENEAPHPDYSDPVIREIEDYAKIKKVDYRTSRRMMMHIDVCRRLVEAKKGRMPIVAFVFGPLGTLSMLRNQQDLYMDLYDDPDAVKAATWQVAETLADYVGALCDTGVDAIMWDTLFASGSIMSKDMWRDMEAEPMRMLAETVRQHGCMNMIHNCGQRIYFDAQIEAVDPVAISFLYPPDDCADYAECKAKYGDRVALIGAVTPANAVIGTDEEWDGRTERYSGVTNVGARAFKDCRYLTCMFLNDDITTISDHAFYKGEYLSAINMPRKLELVDKYAFYGCDTLTFVRARNCSRLRRIEDHAFYSCTMLAELRLPEGLTYIGPWAFAWDRILGQEDTTLGLPSSLQTISTGAFAFVNLNIPANVTSIGDFAFMCDYYMNNLTFSPGDKKLTIGKAAFFGDNHMKSVDLSNRVAQIDRCAFAGCEMIAITHLNISLYISVYF